MSIDDTATLTRKYQKISENNSKYLKIIENPITKCNISEENLPERSSGSSENQPSLLQAIAEHTRETGCNTHT